MKLIIVSGRSGSGKTIALNALDDVGYYCIDNLPLGLLTDLSQHIKNHAENVAVSLDARNIAHDLDRIDEIIQQLKKSFEHGEIFYLDAEDKVLFSRFGETRRRHPLTNKMTSLADALAAEKKLLQPIADIADVRIDTSRMNARDLRTIINEHLENRPTQLSILFKSFGFKYGTPSEADFIFDVRCLPNPYWEKELRPLTGLDAEIIQFLDSFPQVTQMFEMIQQFLSSWLPAFEKNQRKYLTVAIGCTGGQHRSVYLVEKLAKYFDNNGYNVAIKHRDNH